jgi:hypothetical protein
MDMELIREQLKAAQQIVTELELRKRKTQGESFSLDV